MLARSAVAALALFVAYSSPTGASETVPAPSPPPSGRASEPRAPAPWPQIAAFIPGVIVHGSGTWLQRRTLTTQRLLLMEGTGIGLTLLGGTVLFATGAARRVVGPAALTAMAGVNLFALSFLSNVYAVFAPPEGFGNPRRQLPLLTTSLGYLFVEDPQFSFHHFATLGLDARLERWHLEAESAQAPLQGNGRWRLLGGYRFLGPAGPAAPLANDGSFLELSLAFGEHRYTGDGFISRTAEALLEGRLDLQHYLPDVRGAFLRLGAGLAKQWLVFDVPGVSDTDDTSLLLGHFGFGVYLGQRARASASGAELELYYDHRHDGFAGGLKMAGLGSGVPGHFGVRADYDFAPSWGVSFVSEVGSAWTLGLNAQWRTEGL